VGGPCGSLNLPGTTGPHIGGIMFKKFSPIIVLVIALVMAFSVSTASASNGALVFNQGTWTLTVDGSVYQGSNATFVSTPSAHTTISLHGTLVSGPGQFGSLDSGPCHGPLAGQQANLVCNF
jgi:hypothetical protein